MKNRSVNFQSFKFLCLTVVMLHTKVRNHYKLLKQIKKQYSSCSEVVIPGCKGKQENDIKIKAKIRQS